MQTNEYNEPYGFDAALAAHEADAASPRADWKVAVALSSVLALGVAQWLL